MIFKSKIRGRIVERDKVAEEIPAERCAICCQKRPVGASCLRNVETNRILCVTCIVDIAMVPLSNE